MFERALELQGWQRVPLNRWMYPLFERVNMAYRDRHQNHPRRRSSVLAGRRRHPLRWRVYRGPNGKSGIPIGVRTSKTRCVIADPTKPIITRLSSPACVCSAYRPVAIAASSHSDAVCVMVRCGMMLSRSQVLLPKPKNDVRLRACASSIQSGADAPSDAPVSSSAVVSASPCTATARRAPAARPVQV